MSNRNELRTARQRAATAQEELRRIEALPRGIGAHVNWPNGVVWKRIGDDQWASVADDGSPTVPVVYSSAHVASGLGE